MLGNGGNRVTPTFIDRVEDRNGKTIFRHDNRRCEGCTSVSWKDGMAFQGEKRQFDCPAQAIVNVYVGPIR
jgi:membrane carboxypeptidase/penicillin-binding protein